MDSNSAHFATSAVNLGVVWVLMKGGLFTCIQCANFGVVEYAAISGDECVITQARARD